MAMTMMIGNRDPCKNILWYFVDTTSSTSESKLAKKYGFQNMACHFLPIPACIELREHMTLQFTSTTRKAF